ncbi:MAG: glycerate kinase [Microthrixaceae bacterium]|nr:glycerate kinase [Microthrixaceae bacterium]
MRILLAPDKFRGTATAGEVINALAGAFTALGHTVDSKILSDGGEGFLDVFGGPNRSTVVTGPLGDEVEAHWRYSSKTAVIEMSQASGLALVGGAEGNDALAASTFGTGELISRALDAGAKRVIVGIGGSASTDGGLGALRALEPLHRLRGVTMQIACDVRIPFLEAARVFAPQKGASPKEVEFLSGRLVRLSQMFVSDYGVDVIDLVGGGAGGGLAGGLAAIGGQLESGFELAAEEVDLADAVERSDLVVTGEGFLDEESFDGKLVGGVAEYAESFGVPAVAIVGESFNGSNHSLGVVSLVEEFGRNRAMNDTLGCIGDAARLVIERHRP